LSLQSETLVSKFAFIFNLVPLHNGNKRMLKPGVVLYTTVVSAYSAVGDMVRTYPKCHAQMLAKVPKTPPKYPKSHAQMLAI
jgi:hypothetical protein